MFLKKIFFLFSKYTSVLFNIFKNYIKKIYAYEKRACMIHIRTTIFLYYIYIRTTYIFLHCTKLFKILFPCFSAPMSHCTTITIIYRTNIINRRISLINIWILDSATTISMCTWRYIFNSIIYMII